MSEGNNNNNTVTSPHQLLYLDNDIRTVPDGTVAIRCDGHDRPCYFGKLLISATVTHMEGVAYIANCNDILVDPNNPVYCSVDGVVYTRDMKTLVAFPQGKLWRKGEQFLYTFYVPAGTEHIGDTAFAYNRSLKEIVLPDGVESIGASAFAHCLDLYNVNIPESVTFIGKHCFWESTRINRLRIPAAVTPLYTSNLSNAIAIEIDDGVTELEIDTIPIGFPVINRLVDEKLTARPLLLCKNNPVIENFSCSAGYRCITDYTIDQNGVIWTKKELLCFPANWRFDRYQIPAHTKRVYAFAFSATMLGFIWSYHSIPFYPMYEFLDYTMPGTQKPGKKKVYRLSPGTLPSADFLLEDDPLNLDNDFGPIRSPKDDLEDSEDDTSNWYL